MRGKITLPKQVLAGIMRAIKAPVTKSGAPAIPRAYGEGSATPDAATEAKYMAQMTATRDAALKVIELAKQHYDQTSNRTPTDSKALLKKSPGETAETSGNAKANEIGAQTARDVREIQVRLASALKEFADAAGGMPNANALVAVLKARIQTISTKNVDKAKRGQKWTPCSVEHGRVCGWCAGRPEHRSRTLADRSAKCRSEGGNRALESRRRGTGPPLFRGRGGCHTTSKRGAGSNKGIVGVLNYIPWHPVRGVLSTFPDTLRTAAMPKLGSSQRLACYDPRGRALHLKTASRGGAARVAARSPAVVCALPPQP